MMVTEHSFNIALAKEVGIEKAILLKNINWWILKNAKNGKNFRRGKFWTYNSSKAFADLFPYMAEGSIRRWLIELEEENWIITGRFNRRRNDNTKWYTIGESLNFFCEANGLSTGLEENLPVQNERQEGEPELFTVQNEQSSVQNEQSTVQIERPAVQNDQALPDVYTDIKQDVVEVVCKDGNHDNFLTGLKNINIRDPDEVKNCLAELFEIAAIPYSTISAERVRSELQDIREEITQSDIWEQIVKSFIEVSGMNETAKNTNYLIAKIRGKKNDLYSAQMQQKKSKKYKVERIKYAGEDEKGLEMARETFERVKDKLNASKIGKIERMLEERKHLSVLMEICELENRQE